MKKHKNMAKKNMKLNEEGVGDFKDTPGFQRKTTQVTDPVGYLICSKKMLDYVKRKGFNPNLSGNGIIGKGLYFIESNLYPNLDSFRRYGDSAIKVRANGTFNAYQSNYFGGNVFLVPPEQFDSIEILDMIEPGKIQQQKDDMYANYGNRSIGGGAKDMDDFYDLNMPGSLSMQAMEEPDDHVGSLYRDNGQNPRWASPKGDFTTKRISESQLRNMVAESIKKTLNEGSLQYNYNNENPQSFEDKCRRYERILVNLKRKIDILKQMSGNSALHENGVDDKIWNFCAGFERLLDETGLSDFDPTVYDAENHPNWQATNEH